MSAGNTFTPTESERATLTVLWRRYERAVLAAAKPASQWPTITIDRRVFMPKPPTEASTETADTLRLARRELEDAIAAIVNGHNTPALPTSKGRKPNV